MNFLQKLKDTGLSYVLDPQPFRKVVPSNSDKLAAMVKTIVAENLKVHIDQDCDPDGYISGWIIKCMFDSIGFTNYTLTHHDAKRHTLTQAYVNALASSGYKVLFIVDSSTNDMELIHNSIARGMKVIIIDHHSTNYAYSDYPSECIIVNPTLDALYSDTIVYNALSAGAICALVVDYILQTQFGVKPDNTIYLLGVISLYSDCCDLSNQYNIAYIKRFQNTTMINSTLITLFWNEYCHFDRRYISFCWVPRINALMRMEDYDFLYKLFYATETLNLKDAVEHITAVYNTSRERVSDLVSSIVTGNDYTFVGEMVVAYLPDGWANYTGLVANNLASTFSQAVLCLCQIDPLTYKGSVRDPYGRNLLGWFQSVCTAGGHGPAFGITDLAVSQLPTLLAAISQSSALKGSKKSEEVIMMDWDSMTQKEIADDLYAMAMFNEFGGQDLPKAFATIQVKPSYKIYKTATRTSLYGDGLKFVYFSSLVEPGDTLIVAPALSGTESTLIVNTVKLKV